MKAMKEAIFSHRHLLDSYRYAAIHQFAREAGSTPAPVIAFHALCAFSPPVGPPMISSAITGSLSGRSTPSKNSFIF